ncbi:succinylglutamate-semialdehyde dehydrogenase [Halioxenophilus sp. WMMB6]|uniref:succinylglutamate-semialdehyde dehydrogenase n=1 Tax=Halioxenophilus sp. WMMB6 TaxID=3073815 RepID=UPI00295EDBEA|nr:succinylglutamate-semialdehyde dehydrogenase [Halioxenophilus sp. WMMB6]
MTSLISPPLSGECFIGGHWRAGDGQLLHPENPGLEQTEWRGASAGTALVNEAVRAAQLAFADWSLTDFAHRQALLQSYAEQLKLHQTALAEVIHRETGKPLWESKTEVASMIGKIDLSIAAYLARTGLTDNRSGPVHAHLCHRPQGVLAVLGPYNFPGHLPNGHIVPALLAGNCVVFKPSECTPATAELMLRCWQAAGLPTGVLNLLQGGGETGKLLAEHEQLNGLLFTGSSATGARLHRLFGGRPEKLLALEMGGNNPLIVHQVEDIRAAIYHIIQSAFVSSGQRCTCARRLILVRSAQNEALLQQLVAAGKQISVGFTDDDFMGPVIHAAAAEALLAAQSRLIDAGAHPLLTMARLHEHKPLLSPAIIDVSALAELPDEEYFGPLLQVQWAPDFATAVALANHTRFGLSSGLLSDNPANWAYFHPRARAGIVNWNRPLTGASGGAPFGGVGASGNHRPSAFYAADYCAHPMASLLDEQLTLPESFSPGVTL